MTTKDIPNKYRVLYQKAISGTSRAAAIRVFCLICLGFSENEVKNCSDTTCPLYAYRTGDAETGLFGGHTEENANLEAQPPVEVGGGVAVEGSLRK
jgi:hypothetical protein